MSVDLERALAMEHPEHPLGPDDDCPRCRADALRARPSCPHGIPTKKCIRCAEVLCLHPGAAAHTCPSSLEIQHG